MGMSGAGTKLYYGAIGGSDQTEIPNIIDIDLPESDVNMIKDVNYTTPGKVNDYLAGYKDGGVCNVQQDFSPAHFAAVKALEGQKHTFYIDMVDDNGSPLGEASFHGRISKVGASLPMDDKAVTKFSIKVCSDLDVA